MRKISDRRTFVKQASCIAAGLGITTTTGANPGEKTAQVTVTKDHVSKPIPNNPLVLFDNFHVGNRHAYSWKAKFAAAQSAGFDGFEFAVVDPESDHWKEAMDLVPKTNFKIWGFHWTNRAVIDRNADKLELEIEKIVRNVELCGQLPIKPYYTLSLSGTDELDGPTFAERGSAKAQDRHWQRAFTIIKAFDRACGEHGINGSIYPHINWICDTPQSAFKILNGAEAKNIGPAFCSHHWYANKASLNMEDLVAHPLMQNLNYVVLTNGVFTDSSFRAVPFNQGQIDMAWVLANLFQLGYEGPISSQGWRIGGDPYLSCKQFVDGMKALKNRFIEHPELNPLM